MDLIGKKFNLLTVISIAPPNIYIKRNGMRRERAMVNCICDCGNYKTINEYAVKSGGTKSCGCLQKSYKTEGNDPSRRYVYNSYKHGAKTRGLEFNIPYECFCEITSKNCFYCNSVPSNSAKRFGIKNHCEPFIYSGIDRFDNKRGYTVDNIVPCCKVCNIAKKDRNADDFLLWAKMVYNNLNL